MKITPAAHQDHFAEWVNDDAGVALGAGVAVEPATTTPRGEPAAVRVVVGGQAAALWLTAEQAAQLADALTSAAAG